MTKPAKKIIEQIKILEDRGLQINLSRDFRFLYDTNYYRLAGYFMYFQVDPRNGDNRFKSNTLMQEIKDVYLFDETLRQYLFDSLSVLEIVFRSRLAYEMATRLSHPASYLDPSTYTNYETGVDLVDRIKAELDRSKEPFILHFKNKGHQIPIWAAVEVLGFGTISKMYGALADAEVLKAISTTFSIRYKTSPGLFKQLAVIRNICAHHGRLWNRFLSAPASVPHQISDQVRGFHARSVMTAIKIISYLIIKVDPDSTYVTDLDRFLSSQPLAIRRGLEKPQPL